VARTKEERSSRGYIPYCFQDDEFGKWGEKSKVSFQDAGILASFRLFILKAAAERQRRGLIPAGFLLPTVFLFFPELTLRES
jgi:hypothetical protein